MVPLGRLRVLEACPDDDDDDQQPHHHHSRAVGFRYHNTYDGPDGGISCAHEINDVNSLPEGSSIEYGCADSIILALEASAWRRRRSRGCVVGHFSL